MHRMIVIAAAMLVIGGVALAKSFALPKAWKANFEADVPKNYVIGGDECTKVTAIARNLDEPFLERHERGQAPKSRRQRMSGEGKYGNPKELKNWVEFRMQLTCGAKRLWAQIWAKTEVGENYSFAMYRRCPGWAMKQNYLAPTKPDMQPGPGNFIYVDVYNYSPAPKSIEVRMWDAKDFEGQAKGAATCPQSVSQKGSKPTSPG
ncbi:MAG: hypothetical protein ACT4OG_03665 [Alphaproteobacteria bacterium]